MLDINEKLAQQIVEEAAESDCVLCQNYRDETMSPDDENFMESFRDQLETTLYKNLEHIERDSNTIQEAVQELVEWHFYN